MEESEFLELKKSTSELKEAIISIVAILNKHKKGTLYFGIKNDGKVIGQEISELTLREISQSISNNIEPKIYPKIEIEKIETKNCIKLSFEGHEIPYFAYSRAYIRIADENKQLSARELEHMILRKNASKFDSSISDCALDDIDEEALKQFILKANQSKRISYTYTNKKDILTKLGLLDKERVKQAGKLLFSNKEPIEVQAAVFAGITKLTFLDIRQFKGNIFQLIAFSESYIKEKINWRARLVTSTREEIPEIPLRAITESVVNSLCHRDYQAPESNKVAVFKDRVEIWNPGDFPEGYKPEDFIKNDLPSILRNPLIAHCLYLGDYIEKWGSGFKRIIESCALESIQVEFNVLKYGFAIDFMRKETVEKTVEKSTRKVPEKYQKILVELTKNSEISRTELAEKLNEKQTTIQSQLRKLVKKGLIKRVGSDKGGYWKIIE